MRIQNCLTGVVPLLTMSLTFVPAWWSGARADEPGGKANPTFFRTAKVARGDLTLTVNAVGTLQPTEVVDVGAQVEGRIVSFGKDAAGKTIDYNSSVEKDDVLAKIDDRNFLAKLDAERAGLQAAQAKLALAQAKGQKAEANFQRLREAAKGAVSAAELDAAKIDRDIGKASIDVAAAEIAQQKVAVAAAQMNLEATQVRAPVSGTIITRRVNIGQTVVANLNAPSLFLIAADLKKIQVWASINEADVGQVKPDQPVQFTVDAFPNQTFKGKVQQIRDTATTLQDAVTYTVVIAVDNPERKLRPYLTANVRIVTATHKDALLVPNAALRWRPQAEWIVPDAREKVASPASPFAPKVFAKVMPHRVWIVDGKLVRPVQVKVSGDDGTLTEITGSELKDGAEVVVGAAAESKDTKAAVERKETRNDTGDVLLQAVRKTVQNDPSLRQALERNMATMQRVIDSMGKNTILINAGAASSSGVNFGVGTVMSLTPQDSDAIASQCPAVSDVAPLVRSRVQLVYLNRNWSPTFIYGSTPSFLVVRDWEEMGEGDMFSDRDVAKAAQVCVVGETIKRELFQGESPIGKEIRMKNVSFKVIGVLSKKGANGFGMDQDDIVLAPWTTIKYRVSGATLTNANQRAAASTRGQINSLDNLYPGADALYPGTSAAEMAERPQPIRVSNVDQIMVKAASAEDIPDAINQIKELMRDRHHLRDKEDDFNIRDMSELNKVLIHTTKQFLEPAEPAKK